MKILPLPLSLLCLCLPCGLSRGDQPPDGSPVRFQISMDQAAEHKAPEPDPVPDRPPRPACSPAPFRKNLPGKPTRTNPCPPPPPL